MKPLVFVTLLATLATAGCSSLPDRIRGPFAHAGTTATDADAQQPASSSPFPEETDEGKF